MMRWLALLDLSTATLACCGVYLMLHITPPAAATSVYLTQYHTHRDSQPDGLTAVAQVHATSARECAAKCEELRHTYCRMALHQSRDQQCQLYRHPEDAPLSVMACSDCVLHVDQGWRMIFRISSGCGSNMHDTWLSDDVINTENPDMMSIYSDTSGVFKSYLAQDAYWSNVYKVKWVIYKEGVAVYWMVFSVDGAADRAAWFSQDNLLEASAPGAITDQLDFFDVTGWVEYNRRFRIQSHGPGCLLDHGYMMVIDTGSHGGCAFDIQDAYPVFLYTTTQQDQLSIDWGSGDVLAIYALTM